MKSNLITIATSIISSLTLSIFSALSYLFCQYKGKRKHSHQA